MAKKSAFSGFIAQTSQDLENLASSTSGFGTTLSAAIPVSFKTIYSSPCFSKHVVLQNDLKLRFKVVQDDLTSGFAKAIDAFTS